MTKIVHKVIAKTARGLAEEFYESAAHNNIFYEMHPDRRTFVRTKWKYFIGPAREVLTAMLSLPYPDAVKEPIYEALVIDGIHKQTPAPLLLH